MERQGSTYWPWSAVEYTVGKRRIPQYLVGRCIRQPDNASVAIVGAYLDVQVLGGERLGPAPDALADAGYEQFAALGQLTSDHNVRGIEQIDGRGDYVADESSRPPDMLHGFKVTLLNEGDHVGQGADIAVKRFEALDDGPTSSRGLDAADVPTTAWAVRSGLPEYMDMPDIAGSTERAMQDFAV